jgi:hypothetical protein
MDLFFLSTKGIAPAALGDGRSEFFGDGDCGGRFS